MNRISFLTEKQEPFSVYTWFGQAFLATVLTRGMTFGRTYLRDWGSRTIRICLQVVENYSSSVCVKTDLKNFRRSNLV